MKCYPFSNHICFFGLIRCHIFSMADFVIKSQQEAKEFLDLKQQAIQYYQENEVPKKMEEVLNSMFYDNPEDVFGHLANYFETFASVPIISKLNAQEVIDSRGQPTIQADVFCTIKNKEKLVACSTLSSENVKQEDREAEDEQQRNLVSRAIDLVQGILNEKLQGLDPSKQQEVDDVIYEAIEKLRLEEVEKMDKEKGEVEVEAPVTPQPAEQAPAKTKSAKGKKGTPVEIIPDEPEEDLLCGCSAVGVTSQAVCQAAACVKQVSLYEHIAHLRFEEIPEQLRVPLPMATILGSGRAAPGKLNCVKEFMVIPKPGMPVKESIQHIMNIYNTVAKTLAAKGGVAARYVNDMGALCPSLDRPEQGLDMLQEAMSSLGLTPGQDFHIAINCAGHECFDYEKGKYDVVAGQAKLADDVVEFWADILSRYPSVIAVADPMRKVEKEAWMKLCERISERCYVIGDAAYHRPGRLKDEEIPEDFKTSGIVLHTQLMNTVSHILLAAKKMEDANNQIVISANMGETNDTLLVDLAVGVQARFIKLGAPCRGERVAKYNRLLQIETELEHSNRLALWDEHTFPLLTPPPPPPEEGATDGGEDEKSGEEDTKRSESAGSKKK